MNEEPLDLHEIIRQRYERERGSTIVISSRDVEAWYPLFGESSGGKGGRGFPGWPSTR